MWGYSPRRLTVIAEDLRQLQRDTTALSPHGNNLGEVILRFDGRKNGGFDARCVSNRRTWGGLQEGQS